MVHFIASLFIILSFVDCAHAEASNAQCEPSYMVAPTYPSPAYRARVSGNTTIEVQVASSGTVESIIKYAGEVIFRQSSEQAAKAWVFQRSSEPQRHCKMSFDFKMMPHNTDSEDLTTRFIPPLEIEIRHEIAEPTVLRDPSSDPPRNRK
jgi:hypothetical protein